MLKKFNTLAQWIGLIVITLATAYGSLAFFGHEQVVNAAFSKLEQDSATVAVPAVPTSFNYRGTLRDSDNNPIADGEYDITFKIYESMGAPNPLFTQTLNGISVHSGNFSATIKDIPAAIFTDSADRFIGVTVAPFAEMMPRERLSGVPYAVQAEDAHNGVPVGGVVDWWRPNVNIPIPDGFVVCDGSVINDPLSPYNGQATPDLRGQMVRGATQNSGELTTGGAAQQTIQFSNASSVAIGISTATAGNHPHPISGATGSVANVSLGDPGEGNYFVKEFNNGWTDQAILVAEPPAAQNARGEGNHYHAVGTLAVGAAGAHSHTVAIPQLSHTGTQTINTVPPYTNLLKICRTR